MTRANHNFDGWYKEAAFTNPWNFGTDTVTMDTTIYAKWIPVYTITTGTFTSGSVSPSPAAAVAGTTITLTVTPSEGYVLRSGSLMYNSMVITSGPPYTFTMPAANVTISAVFVDEAASWDDEDFGVGASIGYQSFTASNPANALDTYISGIATSGNYAITVEGTQHTLNPITMADGVKISLRGSGTITLAANGSIFTLGYAANKLILRGPALIGKNSNNTVLVNVGAGELVMHAGEIKGNSRTSSNSTIRGGGVGVQSGGTFTMNGGSINGNTYDTTNYANGGGVGLTGGTFTMNGGSIENNITRWGGGVYIDSGTFIMNGGTISGNKVQNTYDTKGGGIFGSNFVMNGGTISNNEAIGASAIGGGVFGSNFVMNGGTISGNTSTANGKGVYGGNFTMSGDAQISADNAVYLETNLGTSKVIFVHGPLSAAFAAAITPQTTTAGTVLVRGTSDPAYTGTLPDYALTALDAGKFTYLGVNPLDYDDANPAAPAGKIP
jgi:uncharacterized repeat protein (TIGR02543 family)